MTREEAKEKLNMMYGDWRTDEEREALEIAIIALGDGRPTGHWEYKIMEGQYCSNCGEQSIWKYDYCPNCGAHMVESEEQA